MLGCNDTKVNNSSSESEFVPHLHLSLNPLDDLKFHFMYQMKLQTCSHLCLLFDKGAVRVQLKHVDLHYNWGHSSRLVLYATGTEELRDAREEGIWVKVHQQQDRQRR